MDNSNAEPEPQSGALRWWHHAKYEIIDGRIQPVQGAKLSRYNVWDAYDPARGQRPYESLLRLPTSDHAAVLRWYTRHGPLGLLLQRCDEATPSPYVVRTQVRGPQTIRASRYVWSPDVGWLHEYSDLIAGQSIIPPAKGMGYARIRTDLLTRSSQTVPLDVAWGPYFPKTNPKACTWPFPGSDAFCGVYSEPLKDFLEAAQLFVHAACAGTAGSFTALNALVRGASSAAFQNRRTGRVQEARLTRSLLSTYAVMVLLDLTAGRERFFRRCTVCGHPFSTARASQCYCSHHCRWADQKRRQRRSQTQGPRRPYERG